MQQVTLKIPKPPSTNNLFVNSPQTRGRFPSPEYKAWRIAAAQAVSAQRPPTFRGPVSVALAIEHGNRADLDNLAKAPLDLMVELRVIRGDGPKIVREVSIRQTADPDTSLTITEAAA